MVGPKKNQKNNMKNQILHGRSQRKPKKTKTHLPKHCQRTKKTKIVKESFSLGVQSGSGVWKSSLEV